MGYGPGAGQPGQANLNKRSKVTHLTLRSMKEQGERIAMLTAYDASFARLLDQAGADVLLGAGHPPHAATEHERADHGSIAPLHRGGPGAAAPMHPGHEQPAGHQEAAAHLEERRQAFQCKVDGQIGGTPDQPAGQQGGDEQGRRGARRGQ